MTRALGLAVLAAATILISWAADAILPRRPTGGFRGLIIVGLVGGLLVGWAVGDSGILFGPTPGGVNLFAAVLGAALSIALISVYTTFLRKP